MFVDNFAAMFVSPKPNTIISFAEEEDDPLMVVITGATRIVPTTDTEVDGRLVVEYMISNSADRKVGSPPSMTLWDTIAKIAQFLWTILLVVFVILKIQPTSLCHSSVIMNTAVIHI